MERLIYLAIATVCKVFAIVIASTAHAYVRAACSHAMGDPLPRQKGRLTLNPFKHVEPIGAILIFISGFGWAQPVTTSPGYYKDMRRGILITYTMPIISNLLITLLCMVGLTFMSAPPPVGSFVFVSGSQLAALALYSFLAFTAVINFKMAVFNLLPVYPFCGARLLSLMVKPSRLMGLLRHETIALLILTVLAAIGFMNYIVNPLVTLVTGITDPTFLY